MMSSELPTQLDGLNNTLLDIKALFKREFKKVEAEEEAEQLQEFQRMKLDQIKTYMTN